MEGWIFIPILIFTFAVGFLAVRNLGQFFDETQSRIDVQEHENARKIHIAMESPEMLKAIGAALAVCKDTNPDMELFLGRTVRKQLLQRLSEGSLDIALLEAPCADDLPSVCAAARLSPKVYAVWNRQISCKDRDRVLFLMENVE